MVVVTGLPGSGKTTLAHDLSVPLHLPVLDKDTFLEGQFESQGVGDAVWRRRLSRESDRLFQDAAAAQSAGAILVSFWQQQGMDGDSGTPTGWIAELGAPVVTLHCVCPPEFAARRFLNRKRHPGHLDHRKSEAEIIANLRFLDSLPPVAIGRVIPVDMTRDIDLPALAAAITEAASQQ